MTTTPSPRHPVAVSSTDTTADEAGPAGRMPRRRSRRRLVVATAVVVVGGAAGGIAATFTHDSSAPAPARPRLATAEVVRTDLVQTQQIDGTLGYAGSFTVVGRTQGTVTWLPPAGQVIGRGNRVYAVDGTDIPLLYGRTPFYRRLGVGVQDGPDVRVLETNLKALGYGADLSVDRHFSSATADAVRAWQHDLGRAETGAVDAVDAVVEPGAVRVSAPVGIVGAAATGDLLALTGTERVVTVAMPVDQEQLARHGTSVRVELPDGSTTGGRITDVGTVAQAPQGSGTAQSGQTPTQAATISVRAVLTDPGAASSLDGAPVSVAFTSDRHDNVLAVPVSALLALAEGGYAVETVSPAGRAAPEEQATRLVPVKLGAFAEGKVEVSGAGLREGMAVEVPSS
nr:peptidoglycan-binding protein [Streptomyces sp. NBC_00899]